jgi:hypothetical protein
MPLVADVPGRDVRKEPDDPWRNEMLTSFTRWFLLWFLATVVLLCLGLGIRVATATAKADGTPATDARLDRVTALQAAGPSPGDHAILAGRLVGI